MHLKTTNPLKIVKFEKCAISTIYFICGLILEFLEIPYIQMTTQRGLSNVHQQHTHEMKGYDLVYKVDSG